MARKMNKCNQWWFLANAAGQLGTFIKSALKCGWKGKLNPLASSTLFVKYANVKYFTKSLNRTIATATFTIYSKSHLVTLSVF